MHSDSISSETRPVDEYLQLRVYVVSFLVRLAVATAGALLRC